MIDLITERTTILTPHSRLSRWMLLRYANRQKNIGKKLWNTPEILPLNAWLQKQWVESWPRQFIFSNRQARKTWEQIIRADKKLPPLTLLHLQGTANQAARAFALLKEYRVSPDPDSFKGAAEFEAFLRWLTEYEHRLAGWGALDPAQVLDAVEIAMRKNTIPVPQSMVLAGFDEITPQLRHWLDFLQGKSVPLQFWPERNKTETPANHRAEIRGYEDQTEEATQCARWVRGIFNSGQFNAGQTVGIVVPELPEYRSILKRELTAELTPGAIFPWLEVEPCFNISLRAPLALEPPINIALLMISIQSDAVPFPVFSIILGTPFLYGGQTESAARHSLELQLRASNTVTVHLSQIAKHRDRDQFPQLISLVHSLRSQTRNHAKKPPSAWTHDLSQSLKDMGWPGNDNTARQKQVLECWRECLDELASLDGIVGSISLSQATDTLAQIAREKQFQVKTREHPIQVISLSEASGMQFDHLWLMGCHAEAMPAPPSPNPFIPPHLQKKHNLPHSTANRELQFAENSLAGLIASSPDTIISFPTRDPRNELRMSPLLKLMPHARMDFASTVSHRIRDQLRQYTLEVWEDPPALALAEDELGVLGGGHQILKNQSNCPFRAFAHHRLHAQAFTTPEIDYDEADRGKIVHKALEIFWSGVRSSENLRKLKMNKQLIPTIKACALAAIDDFHIKLIDQKQFAELEIQRIESLLLSWLETELLRPDFEVIQKEKEEQVRIAGLDIKIRMDRIDKGANDRIILIDYKTGAIKTSAWFEDRPQDPQLPLYAMKISPDAIGFAEVKKGKPSKSGLKFLARDSTVIPGFVPIDFTKKTDCPDWEALLARWEAQLTHLGQEFISGRLEVDPFDINETCNYCKLQTLCRIEERKPFTQPVEEEL